MADWSGEFGNQYNERNSDLDSRFSFWSKIVNAYDIDNVLEIGCNYGRNLLDLRETGVAVCGVDVNGEAAQQAAHRGIEVHLSNGSDTDFNDNEFDMVFTCGVLIHQQTPQLIAMMKEMVRTARTYVLFAEYRGQDEEVPYHNVKGSLFKREFGEIFEQLFPEATRVGGGLQGWDSGFDNTDWWVYDVSNCTSSDGIREVSGEGGPQSEGPTFAPIPLETVRKG